MARPSQTDPLDGCPDDCFTANEQSRTHSAALICEAPRSPSCAWRLGLPARVLMRQGSLHRQQLTLGPAEIKSSISIEQRKFGNRTGAANRLSRDCNFHRHNNRINSFREVEFDQVSQHFGLDIDLQPGASTSTSFQIIFADRLSSAASKVSSVCTNAATSTSNWLKVVSLFPTESAFSTMPTPFRMEYCRDDRGGGAV